MKTYPHLRIRALPDGSVSVVTHIRNVPCRCVPPCNFKHVEVCRLAPIETTAAAPPMERR